MGFVNTAKVLAQGAAWRLSGSGALGRRVVSAFAEGDEDARSVAGIFLTRAGDRDIELVTKALERYPECKELVTVLLGIGSPAARTALERLAEAESHPASGAAAEALEQLARMELQDV